jgi:hypothetical protein
VRTRDAGFLMRPLPMPYRYAHLASDIQVRPIRLSANLALCFSASLSEPPCTVLRRTD